MVETKVKWNERVLGERWMMESLKVGHDWRLFSERINIGMIGKTAGWSGINCSV